MSPAGLTGRLLRVGWAAGRGSRGDRVRFVALLAAAFVLAGSVLAGLAATATYAGRDARDRARSIDAATGGRPATSLWRPRYDAVGERQHQVVYIAPLTASAQPPPGLPRWPAPGEAYLSPELTRAGAGEHIATRYGRTAGTIAPDGLASPAERFAYVRPLRVDPGDEGWFRVAGFGHAAPTLVGESADVRPLGQFLLALGGLVVLPALALVVIAARCGSASRDRRTALLQALGGGWRHRALVNCGEAMVPLTLGTALAAMAWGVLMVRDVRLPVTGYVLAAADLRAFAPWVPVTAAACAAVTLLTVVLLHRADRTGRATRPRSFTGTVPRWRLWACAGTAVLFLAGGQVRGVTGTVLYAAGTAGLWATVPSVAAVAGRRLGVRLARYARRGGLVSPLVAGRWMVAHPGVMVRLATAVVIGAGLVSQTQTWVSRLNEPALEARASTARVGDTIVHVQATALDDRSVAAFTTALPPGFTVLGLRETPQGPLLTGACPSLRALRLTCGTVPAPVTTDDARVRELTRWRSSPSEPLRVATTGTGRPSELVVLADPVRRGQSGRVEQAAYATLSWPDVERPGENWLVGMARNVALGHWVLLFGSAGLAILMLAAALAAAAEFLRFGPALAPLSACGARSRIYHTVAWWNLTFPMALATVVGVTVASWHGLYFIATSGDGQFSWTVMGTAALAGLTLSALVGAAGGAVASRTAAHWRPTGD
ncbi:hypothetical protein [Actinomadura flavalba]|uniref:hypothetical protein n=1 Tax=Actinomadura flavalba TaxID=1120938 RepID=UPI00037DDA6F|nr:hypothetical protein [Actinomadura flavalba]